MQEENRLYKTFFDRLDQLRLRQNWTWEDCARHVGISKAMIFFIRSGKQEVSAKSWHKLRKAERASGFVPPEDYALPKAELDKVEYGIPMDPKLMMDAIKNLMEEVEKLKKQMEELRAQKRDT